MTGADLEALEPTGSAGEPAPPGRPPPVAARRRLATPAVLALAALALAALAYAGVARSQVDALSGDWGRAQADVDVAAYVGDVRSGFAPGALATLGPALALPYADEADRLGALGRRVRSRLVLDPGVRDLRRRVLAALAQREADLRAVAASYRSGDLRASPPLAAERAGLERAVRDRLEAERRRWRLPATGPPPGPAG